MQPKVSKAKGLKTRKFETGYSLYDQAQELSVGVLRDLCRVYGIKLPGKTLKAGYAKALSHYLLTETRAALSQLISWDLELIRDLVCIGPGMGLAVKYESCSTVVYDLLLIKVFRDEEKQECWYFMSDELRNAIGTQAEEILAESTYWKKSEIYQFVQGLKMLYGIVPKSLVYAILRDNYPGTTDNLQMIHDVLECPENMLPIIRTKDSPDDVGFYSSAVSEVFDDPMELESETEEDICYKAFSKKEILDAGRLPYPIFNCDPAVRLKTFICKQFGITAINADSTIYAIWLESQPIYRNFMRSIDLVNKYFTEVNQDDWDRLVFLVNQFLDVAPHWALLGYSLEEERMGKVEYGWDNLAKEPEDDEEDFENVPKTKEEDYKKYYVS